MSFLQPAALWVLLAGLVVIAAYLLRMPRRRQVFPSSLIISMMEQFTRRDRRKLRTVISFVVIAVAFLFTTFDAGRPYRSSGDGNRHDHILLLDVSASMKAAVEVAKVNDVTTVKSRRIDLARKKAKKLISGLSVGDRMMIVTIGGMAQIARNFENDIKLLDESLDPIQALDTQTNWEDAARLLGEVLPAARAPVCHLLTDGSSFDSGRWADLPEEVEWRYYDVVSPEGRERALPNLAITNFRARTTFHSDRDFQIIAEVRNFGETPAKVHLVIYHDEDEIDVSMLNLEAKEVRTEVFSKTLRVGGVLSGRLMQVEESGSGSYPDELDVDNFAYDVVPSPTRPKVLIYSNEKEGFLQSALSANSNALAYRQDPAMYSPDYAADIFLFYNLSEVPGELPDKDVIFVNTVGKQVPIEVQKQFENPMMRTWNRHHPLMNYLSLSNLLIAKAQGFSVPGWAETLAETATGPLIIAGETPERQIAYIGLDPKHSDLPFRVALPMLTANAILWMKDRAPDPDPIQPGETYRIPIAEEKIKEIEITEPDGKKAIHPVQPDGSVVFLDTYQAGVYRYVAGEELGAFTVNLNDPDESTLAPSEKLEIAGTEIETMKEKKAREAWRLWPALAVLALGILLVENSLYHRRILF